MPKKVFMNYKMTGQAEVIIYTETEMAEALGITVYELAERLKGSKYYLAYHAHSLASGEGYWFNVITYQENIAKTNCVDSGGHYWKRDPKSVGSWQCTNCPARKHD